MFDGPWSEISPITIVENDNVRGRQINAKPSSAGSQQKDELFTIRFIVLIDRDDPVIVRCTTINAAVPWG